VNQSSAEDRRWGVERYCQAPSQTPSAFMWRPNAAAIQALKKTDRGDAPTIPPQSLNENVLCLLRATTRPSIWLPVWARSPRLRLVSVCLGSPSLAERTRLSRSASGPAFFARLSPCAVCRPTTPSRYGFASSSPVDGHSDQSMSCHLSAGPERACVVRRSSTQFSVEALQPFS
jgi:hypothetical protein